MSNGYCGNKNVQNGENNQIIIKLVSDVYNEMLNLQAQIFRLEEMLYQNHALDREQMDRLTPENVQKSIPKPPEFGDF